MQKESITFYFILLQTLTTFFVLNDFYGLDLKICERRRVKVMRCPESGHAERGRVSSAAPGRKPSRALVKNISCHLFDAFLSDTCRMGKFRLVSLGMM